jgi:phenylalanyl-tRNA synthetase beta chain
LDVEDDFCRQTLLGLGCELDASDPEGWKVQPPSYRLDLEREVDLSEEIARVYGMDQIPVRLPRVKRSLEASRDKDGHFEFLQWVKDWAAGVGLNEVVNYSFVGASDLDSLGLPSQRRIAVKNPLSADQDTMRTNLAPGLLQCLGHNLSQGNVNLRLFEVAHTFQLDPSSETTAQEIPSLGLLLTGRRLGPGWPNNDQLLDYADIKGLIEHLLASVGRSGRFELSTERPHLDPEVVVLVDGQLLGSLGRIKTELARGYRARDEVWLAEIDLMVLGQLAHERVLAFRDLPKFPPVQRDMTVIAPPGLRLDQITSAVFEQQEGLLEDLLLVDVYRPQGQEETNFTFRLTYRHGQKTLKDKEVDKVHTRIGQRLLEALPVRFS